VVGIVGAKDLLLVLLKEEEGGRRAVGRIGGQDRDREANALDVP